MNARRAVLIFLVFATHVLFSQQPRALTGEQILDKNLDATGGREAWQQIKTFLLEAKFTGPAPSILTLSVVMPITLGEGGTLHFAYEKPDKVRWLTSVDGVGDFLYACNGGVQWRNRDDGSLDVDRSGKSNCKSPDTPKSWGDKYKKIEAKGVKKFSGRSTYVVRSTTRTGNTLTEFFDQETFLRVRSERMLAIPGYRAVTVVEDYSDYREVNGLKIPFFTRKSVWKGTGIEESTTTVTHCAINTKLPESTFAVPPETKTSNVRP